MTHRRSGHTVTFGDAAMAPLPDSATFANNQVYKPMSYGVLSPPPAAVTAYGSSLSASSGVTTVTGITLYTYDGAAGI